MAEPLRSIDEQKKQKARDRKLRWWNKNKERLLAERKSLGVPQFLRSSR
jgi:hypothetical protein